MFHWVAVKLLLKTLAPVLAKEIAELGKKAAEKIWAEVCERVERGEARDHVEAFRLVVKEWALWLRTSANQGPSAEGA